MKLFYLNEHKSCYNYARCVQEGFQYYIFDEGLEHEEELQNDCILFVLKGSLRLSCNEFQFTISEGKMVFVCRESLFSTYSLEKCEVVVALFEGGIWPCQKVSFSELFHLRDVIEYRMEPLEIKDRLYVLFTMICLNRLIVGLKWQKFIVIQEIANHINLISRLLSLHCQKRKKIC